MTKNQAYRAIAYEITVKAYRKVTFYKTLYCQFDF